MGIDARSARRTWAQMDRHTARFAPHWYSGALSGAVDDPRQRSREGLKGRLAKREPQRIGGADARNVLYSRLRFWSS
jgi:hypothetical protein